MKRGGRDASLGRLVEDTFFGEDPLQSFRRFLPSIAASREPDALLCRFFRSGSWGVPHAAVGGIANPRYCCGKTLTREGPDFARARPDDCTDERGCFEPADRSGEPES
jgi:hypothetical protein